jgi:hypothetical protein
LRAKQKNGYSSIKMGINKGKQMRNQILFLLVLVVNFNLNAIGKQTLKERWQKFCALFTCCTTEQVYYPKTNDDPYGFQVPYQQVPVNENSEKSFQTQEQREKDRQIEAEIARKLVDSLGDEDRKQLEKENSLLQGPSDSIWKEEGEQ